MKKTSIVLISCLCLFWFSHWMDCSLYDDLINTIQAQIDNLKMRAQRESNWHYTQEQIGWVLWNSKYADEYNSLKKEYDSAVQQKTDCLNNEKYSMDTDIQYSSDISASNNTNILQLFMATIEAWFDAKDNNDYDKAIEYFIQWNEICEKFKEYENKIWDICQKIPDVIAGVCYIAWVETKKAWNYNKAIEYFNQWLSFNKEHDSLYLWLWTIAFEQKEYENAIKYFTNGKLYAKEQKDKEAYEKYIKVAKEQLWLNNDIATNELECEEGYIMNETETQCVKDTEKQRKLNCSTRYWNKSVLGDNWEDCVCIDWYIRNEDSSQCVKETVEQRKLNCPAWFDGKAYYSEIENDCICNDWYVYDEEYDACLIALDQKSLQSRVINTKDAKCDTTQIISNCSKDPTWNSCPAVCLELYDAINWMYDNELTIYNDPTKFGIYDLITREQASKFFVNFYVTAFDKKDKVIAIPVPSPFNDIKNADSTLYNYILKSYTLKLFKGDNWKFMPFKHLTKAQALAVIIRMAVWILDESQQPRYGNYLYKAESMKLLNNINYSYTTLDNEDIVRWDVALILYRLYDYLK